MLYFIIRALVTAVGLWVAARVFHTVEVRDTASLIIAGFVLGIANAIVRPILTFLTLPLTILTLGLFLLVVNGLMVELTSLVLGSRFHVSGLIAAIETTIIVWVVSLVASWFIGNGRDRRR